MKKLIVLIAAIFAMGTMNMMCQQIVAKADSVQFRVAGEVQVASKNISIATGVVFEDAPALIGHANAGIQYKKFGASVLIMSQKSLTKSQTTYNLVDFIGSYKVTDELTLSIGYELTHWDYQEGEDEVGNNFVWMVTWTKNKVAATGIVFKGANFIYLISSVNYRLMDHVSVSCLIGYTNTMNTKIYGMAGLNLSYGKASLGIYPSISDNPGITVNGAFKF